MVSLLKSHIAPFSLRENVLNAIAAVIAILILGYTLRLAPHGDFKLLLLASMGASTFMLFVVPHSPMAQPAPVFLGQALSALVGVACSHLSGNVITAGACSVGAAVFVMQLLRCLHPPGAATALAAAMSGAQLHDQTLQFLGYAVMGNVLTLLLLAYLINNLLLGRRYPTGISHHPHHAEIDQAIMKDPLRLHEDDIEWALGRMDGIVDVSTEDLVDIYELAEEHAQARQQASVHGTRN